MIYSAPFKAALVVVAKVVVAVAVVLDTHDINTSTKWENKSCLRVDGARPDPAETLHENKNNIVWEHKNMQIAKAGKAKQTRAGTSCRSVLYSLRILKMESIPDDQKVGVMRTFFSSLGFDVDVDVENLVPPHN